MSLQIFNAHTGQRLLADVDAYSSFDSFKAWLSQISSVPFSQQIILTRAGKQAKFAALTTELELFLYNRQLISQPQIGSGRTLSIPPIPQLNVAPPSPAPDTNIDQNDLQSWQKLFEARRNWAKDLLERCRSLNTEIQVHIQAVLAIERGTGVAAGNLQSHVRILEQKFGEACTWSQQLSQERNALSANSERLRSQLKELPGHPALLRLLPKLQASGGIMSVTESSTISLAAVWNEKRLDDAARTIQQATKLVSDHIKTLQGTVDQVARAADELVDGIGQAQAGSIEESTKEVSQLLEEIEVIARKIESDDDHVRGLTRNTRTLPQVVKMGSLHTRNHIPSLEEIYAEMIQHLHRVIDRRNSSATQALQQMQKIASLETDFARVNTNVAELDLSQDGVEALDELSFISQLPMIHGTLLIEAVRRHEWGTKLRSESANLAEDIAGYREEEERRRKKWLKNFGHFISDDAATTTALKFELNLQSSGKEWPSATRDDVSQYVIALKNLTGMENVVKELSEAIRELDKPTHLHARKIKGFKMGSVHEADSRKGSFLLGETDELRALRDVNLKLEEEIKSQKSRVRKLEDLVYKQGQPPRPTSGNLFQTEGIRPETSNLVVDEQSSPPQTPKPEVLARKASVNTRRVSAHVSTDDRTLARRIVVLEAELHGEKQKSIDLHNAADASNSIAAQLRAQIEDIQSTNRDLMANMEAQQHELADERRMLSEDVARHKVRAEELEDELDRVIGSREHEKLSDDERFQALEQQLETTSADHQVELAHLKEAMEEHNAKLHSICSTLGMSEPIPETIAEIIEALDALVETSKLHEKELTAVLALARSDIAALQSDVEKHDQETILLRAQARELDEAASIAKSEHANETARFESTKADLEDARDQLRSLRAKFAEGETGSEALRQRLEQQALKASTLAAQLAQTKSQVIGLDVELSNTQRRNMTLEEELTESVHRLGQRSDRTRDVSQRLVHYVEELTRLLEALGLSIVEREGTMSIQRTSKLVSASTTLEANTGSTSPVNSASQTFDVSIDPGLTRWMHANSEDEEKAQFMKYVNRVEAFNVSKFSEAVVKLRRDVEWTGKKWKAEARSYRDKSIRSQSDAHDKIAYRSFKEGDLALFLPTRNQATRPWAAFNVGAPHYFLREQDSHKLQQREWLVARISKVEDRVVDLSKPLESTRGSDGRSIGESESGVSFEDDNPFELSDGLHWYLLDAAEERSGAPSTPGLGKSTLASVQRVDAKGSIRMKKSPTSYDASTKLNKSLESRRSSTNSRQGSTPSGPGNRQGPVDTANVQAPTSIPPTSAAAEELQRVASLTNLGHARRPSSARSIGNVPTPTLNTPGSSGFGNKTVNIADEHISATGLPHSPPRQLFSLSPSRPSWFGRAASAVAAGTRASPPGRGFFTSATTLSPIAPRSNNQEESKPSTPQQSPSKVTQHLSVPSPTTHSSSASPSKKRPAGPNTTWEPLWSLDMSIEEDTGSK